MPDLEAYKVGEGRFPTFDELLHEEQKETSLKLLQPFGPRTESRGEIVENIRPKEDVFHCNENGHVLTLKTEAQAQAHMDTGKHVRKLEHSPCLMNSERNGLKE